MNNEATDKQRNAMTSLFGRTTSSKNEGNLSLKEIDEFVGRARDYYKTPKIKRDKSFADKFSVQRIRSELVSAHNELRASSYSKEDRIGWRDIILSLSKLLFIASEESFKENSQELEILKKSKIQAEVSQIPEKESEIVLAKGGLSKASDTIVNRFIEDLDSRNILIDTMINTLYSIDDCYNNGYLKYCSLEKKEILINLVQKAKIEIKEKGSSILPLNFESKWK